MTIPTEATEAAVTQFSAHVHGDVDFDALTDAEQHAAKVATTDIISEIRPALEQQIRAQVAQEIRRECDVLSSSTVSEYVVIHVKTGLERAAQIARGKEQA